MSIAETNTTNPTDHSESMRSRASAKVLNFRNTLQEKAAPVGQWAKDRAGVARQTVEKRPVATAGVTAGLALLGGVAIGLLIASRLPAMRRTALPMSRDLVSQGRDLLSHGRELASQARRAMHR